MPCEVIGEELERWVRKAGWEELLLRPPCP